MAEPWLSADDIAAHLGITKDTVYTWIAEKAMPAHKVGRLWKFQASEIDAWVRAGSASSDSQTPAPQPTVGGHSYAHSNEEREGQG
ncbi:MAG: helix-turn-helix domain-containing protein [Thermoleophilia bacterium]